MCCRYSPEKVPSSRHPLSARGGKRQAENERGGKVRPNKLHRSSRLKGPGSQLSNKKDKEKLTTRRNIKIHRVVYNENLYMDDLERSKGQIGKSFFSEELKEWVQISILAKGQTYATGTGSTEQGNESCG